MQTWIWVWFWLYTFCPKLNLHCVQISCGTRLFLCTFRLQHSISAYSRDSDETKPMHISGGSRGGWFKPTLCPSFLNILWKWNNLVSVRPNYFIFMGCLRKMRYNHLSEPLHLYTYEHPLKKSWIRPCALVSEVRVYEIKYNWHWGLPISVYPSYCREVYFLSVHEDVLIFLHGKCWEYVWI